MSTAAIRREALNLPPTERAKLIDALWDSLSPADMKARESAWAAEAERRVDAFDDGRLAARDSEDVLATIRQGLRK